VQVPAAFNPVAITAARRIAANIAKLPELLRRSPIIGIRTKTARL
jgi:hypothetical protein